MRVSNYKFLRRNSKGENDVTWRKLHVKRFIKYYNSDKIEKNNITYKYCFYERSKISFKMIIRKSDGRKLHERCLMGV